jgi:hypothetical protein
MLLAFMIYTKEPEDQQSVISALGSYADYGKLCSTDIDNIFRFEISSRVGIPDYKERFSHKQPGIAGFTRVENAVPDLFGPENFIC